MSTKTISGTYTAGYLLSTSFDAVIITASGSVGGFGLVTSAFTSVTNSGHLEAASGDNGITLGSGGGSLTSEGSSYIRGGAAKAASGAGTAGKAGGAGVYVTVYGSITDNLGYIVGGSGGTGVAGTIGGAGGAGGVAARFEAGGYVRNQGIVRGGAGGNGGAGSSTQPNSGGAGGTGGDGVSMAAAGTVVNYSAHIYGGAGGRSGVGAGGGSLGGFGGIGIYLAGGGYVEVYHGLVRGGAGGYGGTNGGGGGGGVGMIVDGPAATVLNFGSIVGGAGGAGGAGGGGGANGVQLNHGVELVNQGVISGGSGGSGVAGTGAPGADGGYGAVCTNDCTILNYGSITSGVGGTGETDGLANDGITKGGLFLSGGVITNGSSTDTNAFIGIDTSGPTGAKYGIGIYVGYSIYTVTVTNFGTIGGGSSPGAHAVFIEPADEPLSSPPTLVVEAGCAFIGSVFGGGQGDLVLASGVGTVSGFGDNLTYNLMTVSGSMATTTFTAFATLDIGAGASFTLAAGADVPLPDGAFAENTLIVAGGATIAATLGVEGTIDVSGKLTGAKNSSLIIDGGTANFTSGASLSAPTVDVSGVAQVNVETNLVFDHVWDQTGGALSVDKGDILTLRGFGSTFSGLLVGSGGIGTIAFAPTAPGTFSLDGVTISELLVDVSDASLVVGSAGATIASTGTVRFYGANADSFGGANTLTNAGLIETTSSAGATIIDAIVNTGKLYADDGVLTLDGAVTGTGIGDIKSGTLFAASIFNEKVAFVAGATGTLELADAVAYTGRISGFSTTGKTTLDLTDITFTGATVSYSGTATSGVLTVKSGANTAKINLTGNYTTSTFTLGKDAGGGTIVTDPAATATKPPVTTLPLVAAMAGFGGAGGGSHTLASQTSYMPANALAAPGCAIA